MDAAGGPAALKALKARGLSPLPSKPGEEFERCTETGEVRYLIPLMERTLERKDDPQEVLEGLLGLDDLLKPSLKPYAHTPAELTRLVHSVTDKENDPYNTMGPIQITIASER